MVIKNVKKRNGELRPFNILKIREQAQFAVKGTKISSIEFESLISLTMKENALTTDIQKNLVQVAVHKIDIDNSQWNLVAGRASMYDLYRNIYKTTKYETTDWQEHIKYLVRNDYYRKDIANFLEKLTKKQIAFIDKRMELKSESNYDFKMVYAQTEMLKSKYLIKNKRGVIEYPILADIVNSLIISRGDEHFEKIFYYIHNEIISLATPFKRNLRRPNGNVGSCFIGETSDSLGGLMKGFTDMAMISKEGGGIGWYLGKIRPEDTYSYKIVKSNNITKWVKIINDIAVAVNQAGARPGAITVALDWWHLDIESFLDIKSELNGDLRDKAFDIFPQLVGDRYFFEAAKAGDDVYQFNHYEYQKSFGIDVTELVDEELYKVHMHVKELAEAGKWRYWKKINAKALWKKALWTWIELGDFYIVNKDGLNFSNYLKFDPEGGITKNANLCVESFSFTKAPTKWTESYDGEKRKTIETNGLTHACNLASIVATNMISVTDIEFEDIMYYAVLILDRSIDEGKMPVLEAKKLSDAIRNIGIGLLGMGDLMAYNSKMYDTEDGQLFAEKFIEKMSYYAYKGSNRLAKETSPYPLFKAENYDKLIGLTPQELQNYSVNGLDWISLHKDILEYGMRNFYLLAFAPNSSTGILMWSVASYLPVYNKEMVQTLADLTLPIMPKYIDKHYWSYKTKFQYHPSDIIRFTSRMQKWVDTGISMEININPDLCKINEISDTILEEFVNGFLKTVYYSLTIDGARGGGCTDCAN